MDQTSAPANPKLPNSQLIPPPKVAFHSQFNQTRGDLFWSFSVDLLLNLISFLQAKDLFLVRTINKLWKHNTENQQIWKNLSKSSGCWYGYEAEPKCWFSFYLFCTTSYKNQPNWPFASLPIEIDDPSPKLTTIRHGLPPIKQTVFFFSFFLFIP